MHEQALQCKNVGLFAGFQYFEDAELWLSFADLSFLLLVMHGERLHLETTWLTRIFAQPSFMLLISPSSSALGFG